MDKIASDSKWGIARAAASPTGTGTSLQDAAGTVRSLTGNIQGGIAQNQELINDIHKDLNEGAAQFEAARDEMVGVAGAAVGAGVGAAGVAFTDGFRDVAQRRFGDVDLDVDGDEGDDNDDEEASLDGGNTYGYDDDEEEEVEEEEQEREPIDVGDGFYKASVIDDGHDDELLDNIRLQTAGLSIADSNADRGIYQDSGNFLNTSAVFDGEFDFSRLLKNQYLIFSDYDISDILDFIFTLNAKHHHKVTYPAAVIYQCVRYADHIKNNDILVENFLNLTFTKIRSNITSSMTGITNVLKDGDIVLQSYWVSVVNFLYYYLCKDDGFFERYPKVLQELIITLNSLILELSNGLKFRMGLILDDCLLNYTNIPDLSETLYKSDWNFFKRKHVKHSAFDDIYQMLYPPSVKQQLKPSPIKIVQTLGALIYVLDIHQVHPLIKQQCFSIVFQWLSFTLSNKILANKKKYLSRKKAIQIRLNLSTLEDWARSNNLTPKMPDIDLDIYKKFPYNLTEDAHKVIGDFIPKLTLHSCLFYRGDSTDPSDLAFYHNSLFDILRYFFEPLFEILQFLQCFTGLKDQEELATLLPNLSRLNHLQLLQILNKYRYEVDEAKVPTPIRAKIHSLTKTEVQNLKRLPYLDKNYIYLNPDHVYPVALPTLNELVDEYGSGIGGIDRERAVRFQPFLPYEIIDAIDDIHEQKSTEKEHNEKYGNNEGEENEEDDDEEDDEDEEDEEGDKYNNGKEIKNKDDGLFAELQIPRSLVHKTWGGDDENEVNPW